MEEGTCPAAVPLRCLFAATVDLFKSYGLNRMSLPAELAGDFGTAGRGEVPVADISVANIRITKNRDFGENKNKERNKQPCKTLTRVEGEEDY